MSVQQLVVFNVNGEGFGIEITQVREIIQPQEIFKLPNTPDYIEGLLNLRGKVHTVFNLRKRFNLPEKEFDEGTRIIIVNVESMAVGFIVDEVNEIIRIEEQNIQNDPQASTNLNKKFVKSIAKVNENVIIILDLHETVLNTDPIEIKA
jgi:purine-binding chemotaxis protein CheW